MGIREHPISQSGEFSTAGGPLREDRLFKIDDAAESTDAIALVLTELNPPNASGKIPATSNGMALSGFDWQEDGRGCWTFVVHYTNPGGIGGGSDGDQAISFNTAGATEHVTTSKELVSIHTNASSGDPGIETGVGQPIGASSDGVEGTDLPVPVFEFEITRVFGPLAVNAAYINALYELTRHTNNASVSITGFPIFGEGQLLFLGAQGTQPAPNQNWTITFKFWAGTDVVDAVIGDITGCSKKAWELFDVRYRRKSIGDGENAVIEMVPRLVLVHRVFDPGDFDALDLS